MLPLILIAAFAVIGIGAAIITHNPNNPVTEMAEEAIEHEAEELEEDEKKH